MGAKLASHLSESRYPLKAGHLYDFHDLALPGVFVSEAEAGSRYGVRLNKGTKTGRCLFMKRNSLTFPLGCFDKFPDSPGFSGKIPTH